MPQIASQVENKSHVLTDIFFFILAIHMDSSQCNPPSSCWPQMHIDLPVHRGARSSAAAELATQS